MNNIPKYIIQSTVEQYLNNPNILRNEMKQNGFVHIPNVITSQGIQTLIDEAEHLKHFGFSSFERHNIFLQDEEDGNDDDDEDESWLLVEDDPKHMLGKTFRDVDMKNILSSSSKILIHQKQIMDYSNDDAATTIAGDDILSSSCTPQECAPQNEKKKKNGSESRGDCDDNDDVKNESSSSALIDIYHWEGLRTLLLHAFFDIPAEESNNNNVTQQEQLYISGDEYGGVYYNFFEDGDQLGWHFDRSEFSTSLILRLPDNNNGASDCGGGEFMYWPNSRQYLEQQQQDDDEAFFLTLPNETDISIPSLQVGSLYLFEGRRSLHAVSRVNLCHNHNNNNQKIDEDDNDAAVHSTTTRDTTAAGNENQSRLNAIFTFNREPNHKLNAYTLKKFFGVLEDDEEKD